VVSDPSSSIPPPSRPTFWHRRVVGPIAHQLTQGITPEKIALTLAVGSACALFPIPATATLLCFVVGIILRLNQPLIQLVNALCAVPHILVVYELIRLGDFLFGVPQPRFTVSEFVIRRPHSIPNLWAILINLWRDHGLYFHRFGEIALHALVAWAIIAPFWIFSIYKIAYPALRKAALRRGSFLAAGELTANAGPPPVDPAP